MIRTINVTMGVALGIALLGVYALERGLNWGLYLACRVLPW
jgi:hypothetical protein